MRTLLLAVLMACPTTVLAADPPSGWRALPLVKDGKVDPAWAHVGYGSFAVDDATLRTESDPRGLGLLVYRPEKFGNCVLRVVFKSKDAKSNSGVYVRIDDGILAKLTEKHAPGVRDKDGKLTAESTKVFMDASERGLGPWYAVHHGYEVQICDASDEFHRTGSIYSLSKAAAPQKPATDWKTMFITLQGNRILVDIDARRITEFDPDAKDIPSDRKWYDPRRDIKRPTAGYIGLQTHDPGDVVWFKEICVRPLEGGR